MLFIGSKNSTYNLFHHQHTRAIHLLDKGVNIIYIKKLLRHVSITTT